VRCGYGRSVYLPLSVKHGIDLGSSAALRRGVLHLFNLDFAVEWPRALPPNVKLVGPLMPEPAHPLPADLQVHTCLLSSLFQSFTCCASGRYLQTRQLPLIKMRRVHFTAGYAVTEAQIRKAFH
jgi:hypothetical protein